MLIILSTTTYVKNPWLYIEFKLLHCSHFCRDVEKEKLIIRGGEYDVHLESSMEQAPHQDRHVNDIIIHPFYHPDVLFNDMALLVVKEQFTLKPHIAPACVPLPDTKFADPSVYDPDKCVATGWGKDLHGWYICFHRKVFNCKYTFKWSKTIESYQCNMVELDSYRCTYVLTFSLSKSTNTRRKVCRIIKKSNNENDENLLFVFFETFRSTFCIKVG